MVTVTQKHIQVRRLQQPGERNSWGPAQWRDWEERVRDGGAQCSGGKGSTPITSEPRQNRTHKRSIKSGGLHLHAFVLLRLEDQLAKRAQKEELMVQINGGACFYSSAAESVTTSVLIVSTDSWHQTADRYWRICFISTECLHEDHLLHLWVRPRQYLHPHNRTMFTLNYFSSLYHNEEIILHIGGWGGLSSRGLLSLNHTEADPPNQWSLQKC